RQVEVLRLAHGRRADLEELVEVGAGDAQEAEPFQQRYRRVLRQRQHPELEVELAEFAAAVQRRVAQRVGALVAAAHAGLPWARRGRTRSAPKWQEKVLPRPTSLSIASRAWCRPSTCLTIASPRPVPPFSRERLAETR